MSACRNWTASSAIPWAGRVLALCLGLAALFAPAPCAAWEEVPRQVLAVYDSATEPSPDASFLFEGVQTVLNYYGIMPRYHDIRQPLPGPEVMASCVGFVASLRQEAAPDPRAWLDWVAAQMAAGRKAVFLNSLGVNLAGGDSGLRTRLSRVLGGLGLTYEPQATANSRVIRFGARNPAMVEFERPYPPLGTLFEFFRPVSPEVAVHLTLARTDRPGQESAVVVTGKGGGLALEGTVFWMDPVSFRKQWHLNPFAFLSEALGLADRPAPDPTTLNGLRAAFSHVDADGFSGLSQIDKKSTCAEMLRDRVITAFGFPVTFSLIVAEVDPGLAGGPKSLEVARDILALPNVEPGSHSFSHPFYWDANSTRKADYDERFPFAIPGYAFDERTEIVGSAEWITRHASPPGKPCRIIQWSGDCMPTEAQLAMADEAGMLNINGGDTVFDQTRDSLFGVAPLYRPVGRRFQIHIGQANENILTNKWEGPFYAFRNIIETMRRTESPRRLKPIDIYYHVFSAELPASLRALEEVHAWVLAQDTARMFTSRYLEMMRGYLSATIRKDGPRRFEFSGYGACATFRLPADSPPPDLARCENVLGYAREPQGLYVSLVPGKGRAVLVLADPGKASGARPPGDGVNARVPHLRKASGLVTDFAVAGQGLGLTYQGFGPGRVELAGLAPGAVLEARGEALSGGPRAVTVSPDGTLNLTGLATGGLEVRPR